MFRFNHHHQGAQYSNLLRLLLNIATDIHQLGPNNICSHTTKLTTTMYFNLLF